MNRWAAAAFAVALMLTGCSQEGAGGEGSDQTVGFTQGDGTVTILPAGERPEAPILEGPALGSDESLSTKDLLGKPVVINVWGSWCAPCRAEAPELVEAANELGDDVHFLGLNTRDLSEAPAEAFIRSFEIPYPNIYDPDGKLLLGFKQLPPTAIPSTIVIDAEGRVAARAIGEVNASTLIGILEDVG